MEKVDLTAFQEMKKRLDENGETNSRIQGSGQRVARRGEKRAVFIEFHPCLEVRYIGPGRDERSLRGLKMGVVQKIRTGCRNCHGGYGVIAHVKGTK
jgi:hypothetical protein